MNIKIKTTSITLTPSISEYVEKRLDAVEKFLSNDPSAQCDVDLGRTTVHHKNGDIFRAEVHIVGADKNLYASAEKEDLYAAIDAVRDEILREVKSSKDKRQSLMRRGGAKVKNIIRGMWPGKN